jgi:glycosyltransferase involved in cell wall biosynthesis
LHCPFFVVIYDTTFKLYPQKADKLFRLYLNFLLPAVLRKASKIITLSTNSKMDIIKYFQVPEEKIEVIYGAADSSFQIVDDDTTRRKIRERFRLPDKYILNVNVLEPRKNIETLLSAYDRIRKTHAPPCKLVIVGGRGWGYQRIFQTVNDLHLEKDVVFTGFVPDEALNYLYNMAEVFVFPSLYEGYGLPVIEAMACGCPVISSNRASLPEVVGDSGLLVDPEDIEAMAAAIWKVISNPRLNQDLRKKSLERSKHFSWENSGQKLKTLINQTMGENGR